MILYIMIVNIKNELIQNTADNSINIEMFTAIWCPPCKLTKKFLFSENIDNNFLRKQILTSICSYKFQELILFNEFQKYIEKNKSQLEEFYMLGMQILNNISDKNTSNIDIEIINLGNIILKNMTANNPNTNNVAYLGFVYQISKFTWNIYIIDIDQHESYAEQNNIRSIPCFKITIKSKMFNKITMHQGGVVNSQQINSLISNSIF